MFHSIGELLESEKRGVREEGEEQVGWVKLAKKQVKGAQNANMKKVCNIVDVDRRPCH